MHCFSERLSQSLRFIAVAAAVTALPMAAAAQDCVEFEGLEHCALGGASLSVSGGSLIMDENLDMAPDFGVDVNFSEGVVWSSGIKIGESADENTSLTASAYSEGEVTSTNTVRRNDEGSLAFSADFTGAAEGQSN